MDLEQKQLVLQKYLSGERSHIALASAADATVEEVKAYFHSRDFKVSLLRAKKDMVAYVVDSVKERLVKYKDEMEDLALNATDPRVRFQALKDLLDRGGTGGTQKLSLTSPAAYKRIIEEFTDGKEVDGAAPGDNPDPDELREPAAAD